MTTEHGPPSLERDVGGKKHRHPDVEVIDELEEQIGRLVINLPFAGAQTVSEVLRQVIGSSPMGGSFLCDFGQL